MARSRLACGQIQGDALATADVQRGQNVGDARCDGHVGSLIDDGNHRVIAERLVTGKRERIAGILDRTGLTGLILRVRARLPEPLSVLTYHSVAEAASPGLDEEVVDATPAQFDEQLTFIARFFSVIGIEDLERALAGERLPANPLMITFDDGYLSNYDTALPLLERHGLTATFFIATEYVEQRRLYWWDRINYLINNARVERFSLTTPRKQTFDRKDRAATIDSLLKLVKQTPGLDLEAFLEELTIACDAPWSRELERELADRVIMTWDQVRALRDAGMDVQSHTRNHRVLQTLDAGELEHELRGSREDLEAQLDQPVRAIAYPVGRPIADVPAIRNAVRDAGYTVGFSNATGVNYRLGKVDPFDLRRLAANRDTSMAMFSGSLALPPLAYTR